MVQMGIVSYVCILHASGQRLSVLTGVLMMVQFYIVLYCIVLCVLYCIVLCVVYSMMSLE